MEEKTKNNLQFWAKVVFGFLLLILIIVLFFDRHAVEQLIFNVHWSRLVWSLIFAFTSLFCATYGFYFICRELNLKVDSKRLFWTGFSTIAINGFINSANAAAFSLRVILLKKKDVNSREIISASVFHSYFNLLVFILFLPFIFFFLSFSAGFPFQDKIILTICGAILMIVFIFASYLFFSRRARSAAINFLDKTIRRFNHNYRGEWLAQFHETLDYGASVISKRKNILIVFLATFFDWIFMLMSLWVCFWTLGIKIDFGLVLSGFFVGVILGFISLIPGGIGVQEGSMSGVYALLGVPFSQAIIVALFFRIIYYIIPFVVAVIIYGRLLKNVGQKDSQPTNID
jgi:glycosyltransferase 2 family protein